MKVYSSMHYYTLHPLLSNLDMDVGLHPLYIHLAMIFHSAIYKGQCKPLDQY